MIALENYGWQVQLRPKDGGAIHSVHFNGQTICKSRGGHARDPFLSAGYPLIPFSNRIKSGRFTFAGQEHNLMPNREGEAYPIHGAGWMVPWTVVHQTPNACEISMHYRPQTGKWPWSFVATQKFEITPYYFEIQMSMTNTDHVPSPAGIGLHPFFDGADSAHVMFEAGHYWTCGDDLIPIGPKTPAGCYDFSKGQWVKTLDIDNCFSDWGRRAHLRWPDRDKAVVISGSDIFRHLVVYMHPDNDSFCLEPVSHINNVLNMTGQDMTAQCKVRHDRPDILAPGQTLFGTVKISIV